MIKKGQAQASNEWHKGPPPSLGWWPASAGQESGIYRWWDGKYWSDFALENYSAEFAEIFTQRKVNSFQEIQWQHRPTDWPARSRT